MAAGGKVAAEQEKLGRRGCGSHWAGEEDSQPRGGEGRCQVSS